MAEVFMVKRGQLDNRSKSDLRKAGVVVVEVEDLAQAQFVRSSEVVSSDDMLWAAIDALRVRAQYSGDEHNVKMDRLAANLFNLMVRERNKRGALTYEEEQ
jgi:hypothetical protein